MENKSKIPVLFLLMEFAPVNTTGNFRGLKFIKYITRFNIQPIVITFREEEGARHFNTKIDESLLNDLPAETIIYRIHCRDRKTYPVQRVADFLRIYFSIKDDLARRWKPYLFRQINSIVRKHSPEAIFTSVPPFSSGLLSVEISKKFNLPLIVDMRDLWALFGNAPSPSFIHYHLTIKEERKIFEHAEAIIGVTPQLIDTLHGSHPTVGKNKFHLIPNGFDRELENCKEFEFKPGKDKVIIGYTGSFYYNPEQRANMFKPRWKKRWHKILEYVPLKQDWLYRSPYFFFKTLHDLFIKYPYLKDKIQIEFIGKTPLWLDGMLKEFNLADNYVSYGFVSHKQSVALQQRFDLSLATSEKVINGEHYCLPSKLFDYVGQNKPILAFVTEGIQKEFLQNSGLAVICNPDNIEESVKSLHDLLLHGKVFKPDYNYLQQFHRYTLTKKLARIIHSVTRNKMLSENSLIDKEEIYG